MYLLVCFLDKYFIQMDLKKCLFEILIVKSWTSDKKVNNFLRNEKQKRKYTSFPPLKSMVNMSLGEKKKVIGCQSPRFFCYCCFLLLYFLPMKMTKVTENRSNGKLSSHICLPIQTMASLMVNHLTVWFASRQSDTLFLLCADPHFKVAFSVQVSRKLKYWYIFKLHMWCSSGVVYVFIINLLKMVIKKSIKVI